MRSDRYVTSLDGLPIDARPPKEVGPFRESEIRERAKVRQRSKSGPGAIAWLRARPVDASRVIPAQEFRYAGRRHLGIEEHLVAMCPACGAADANTRHAQLCHGAGAQVNQYQRLVNATSRFLKRMFVRHQVESGASFIHRQGLTYGHRYRERRPPRRVGIGFPTQKRTHQSHLREPSSGG